MFNFKRASEARESLTSKEMCASTMLSRMTYGDNGEYDLSKENLDTIKIVRRMGVDPEKLFKLADEITGQINGGNWKALL